MASYPEIEALNKIYVNHQMEIEFSTTDFLTKNKEYCAVAFTIEKETFYFYVEDEYGDIKYNYPLLNIFSVKGARVLCRIFRLSSLVSRSIF